MGGTPIRSPSSVRTAAARCQSCARSRRALKRSTWSRARNSSFLGRLELAHPGGLFAGPVVGGRPYRLRILWPNAVQETEDPYSFGLLLGELDLHLIAEGTHYELARCLGAQAMTIGGVKGVRFAVWSPNARRASVVGDFNTWDGRRHPMRLRREAASGSCSFRGSDREPSTNTSSSVPTARCSRRRPIPSRATAGPRRAPPRSSRRATRSSGPDGLNTSEQGMPLMLPWHLRNMDDGFAILFSHKLKGPARAFFPDKVAGLEEVYQRDPS